jgi:hypothetical protein
MRSNRQGSSDADRDARNKRAATLRAELLAAVSNENSRLHPSPPRQRVIIATGRGCTWEENWYIDVAKRLVSENNENVAPLCCEILWSAPDVDGDPVTTESIAADMRAGGWKARMLQEDLGSTSAGLSPCSSAVCAADVVLGHSQGANAALRVAERHRVKGLVLVSAGYTVGDRVRDRTLRAEILATRAPPSAKSAAGTSMSSQSPCSGTMFSRSSSVPEDEAAIEDWRLIAPWNFAAIVHHCDFVSLVHAEDDSVVPYQETVHIFEGLKEAAAAAAEGQTNSRCVVTYQIVPRKQRLGHAMASKCPAVLHEVLRVLRCYALPSSPPVTRAVYSATYYRLSTSPVVLSLMRLPEDLISRIFAFCFFERFNGGIEARSMMKKQISRLIVASQSSRYRAPSDKVRSIRRPLGRKWRLPPLFLEPLDAAVALRHVSHVSRHVVDLLIPGALFAHLAYELEPDIYFLVLRHQKEKRADSAGEDNEVATENLVEEQNLFDIVLRRYDKAYGCSAKNVSSPGWENVIKLILVDQKRIANLLVDDLHAWPLMVGERQNFSIPRYLFILCTIFLQAMWPEIDRGEAKAGHDFTVKASDIVRYGPWHFNCIQKNFVCAMEIINSAAMRPENSLNDLLAPAAALYHFAIKSLPSTLVRRPLYQGPWPTSSDLATSQFLEYLTESFLRKAQQAGSRHQFTAVMASHAANATTCSSFNRWRLSNVASYLLTIPDDDHLAYTLLVNEKYLGSFLEPQLLSRARENYAAIFDNPVGIFQNVLH